MSAITTLNDWITGASFRSQVNTNFSNLNTDKLESTNLKTVNWNSLVWSGDIVISGGWSVATDAIWDAKGDLAVGTGANTASRLAVGANGTVLVADSAEATGVKWASVWGTGDVVWPASSTDNALVRMDWTTGKVIQNSTVTLSDTGDIAGVNEIQVVELRASSSAWVDVHNNSGTQVAIFGAGWSTWSTLVWTTNVGSASADYHQFWGGTGTITDTATGSSTNININVVPKWTGRFQAGWVNVPTISSTDTLTNKRITDRIKQDASHTTSVTMDSDSYDEYDITAQAGALLFNNPSWTPTNCQKLMVRIKDNWTARALTYWSQFASWSATLPTTTTLSKKLWIWFEWDSTDSKWYCLATGVQP